MTNMLQIVWFVYKLLPCKNEFNYGNFVVRFFTGVY